MRRYWIDPDQINDDHARITGEVFHHIHEVCRQNEGDRFEILTGDGKAHLVEVERVTKKDLTARILETREIAALPKPYIHLAISIPRFPVFDAVLEKAVELGVHSVHPFVSEFSFVREEKKISEEKFERWGKIVRSATQQSGRGDRMTLESVCSLSKTLDSFNRSLGARGLFSYEGDGDQHVQEALAGIGSQQENLRTIWVFVGSEGGFSHREVELFREHSMIPVTLGSQVLRVETACLALVSVIKYHFGLMK